MEISKSDWILYRKKLAGWQEAHMEKLCREYAAALNDDRTAPSERFWTLEQRIREDQRHPGIQVVLRRSSMLFDLAQLVAENVISLEDLSEFSKELQDTVKVISKHNNMSSGDELCE